MGVTPSKDQRGGKVLINALEHAWICSSASPEVDAESCCQGSGGFVMVVYDQVSVRGTAEELKGDPAVQHCHFQYSRCVCASVSMSISDEKQKPNKHEATKRETIFFPTVKHFSVGPRKPLFLLQLDTSLPNLSSPSDLMFLEKGQYCWSRVCTATFQ